MKHFIFFNFIIFFQNTFGQGFKVEYLIKSSDTISNPQPDYIFYGHYQVIICGNESQTKYFEPKKRRKQRIKLLRQGKLVSELEPFGKGIRYNNIKDSISIWRFREYLVTDHLKNWK